MKLILTLDAKDYAELIEEKPSLAELIDKIILRKECICWSEEVEEQ